MSSLVNWSPDIDYDTIWLVVEKITNEISGRGIEQLKEKLQDEGLELTGKLKGSLKREVRQNNGAWITEMAMQFEMYGRFKDLREMRYDKQIPTENEDFKQWVGDVMEGKNGKTPFSFISGRKGGSRPPAGLGHFPLAFIPARCPAWRPWLVHPQLHAGNIWPD